MNFQYKRLKLKSFNYLFLIQGSVYFTVLFFGLDLVGVLKMQFDMHELKESLINYVMLQDVTSDM